MMFFPRDSSIGDSVTLVDGARTAAPSLRQAGSLDVHLLSDFGCKGRAKVPQWPSRDAQARSCDLPRASSTAPSSVRQADALASVLFTSLDVKNRGFVLAAEVSREVHSLAAMNPRFQEAARGVLTRLAPCQGRQMSHDDLVATVSGSSSGWHHQEDPQLCSMLQHLVSSMCATHPLLSPATITLRHAPPLAPHPHFSTPLPTLSAAPQLPPAAVHTSSLFLPSIHTATPPAHAPPSPSQDTEMSSASSSPTSTSSHPSSFGSDSGRVPDVTASSSYVPPANAARLSAAKIRLHHLIDLEVPTLSSHRHARSTPTASSTSSASELTSLPPPARHHTPSPPPATSTSSASSAHFTFSAPHSDLTNSQFSFPSHSDNSQFSLPSTSQFSSFSAAANTDPAPAPPPQPRLRPARTPPSNNHSIDLLTPDDAQVPSCTLLADRLREEEGWGGLGSMEGMMYAGPPSGLNAASFSLLDCNTIFESPLVQALMHNHEAHVGYL